MTNQRRAKSAKSTLTARVLLVIILLLSLPASALAGQKLDRQTTAATPPPNRLYLVYLDLANLKPEQKQSFEKYLETATLPKTAVGNKCTYYGRPHIWCLLLRPMDAAETFIKLKSEDFGKTARLKPATRLGANQ